MEGPPQTVRFAAPSTEELHEVLVKASMVAWMQVDPQVTPGPSEQLIHSVYKNYRTGGNEWPEIAGAEEEGQAEADEDMYSLFHARMGRCVAEPGEYEESTDDEKVDFPRPDVVVRLKPEVGRKNGMISEWKRFQSVNKYKCDDGTVKQFPQGSIWLDCCF